MLKSGCEIIVVRHAAAAERAYARLRDSLAPRVAQTGGAKRRRNRQGTASSSASSSSPSSSSSSSSFIGVDCEGMEGKRAAPMMIQCSSATVCVVEVPDDHDPCLSAPLRRLLRDKGITKVFCDARGDVKALRCEVKPVADVQTLAKDIQYKGWVPGSLGYTTSGTPNKPQQLGLAGCMSIADPAGGTWKKQSFSKRGWWKLRSGRQMLRAPGFIQYAAGDAWATWQAFEWFRASKADEAWEDPAGGQAGRQGFAPYRR